jgi:hypothetical protein
MLLKLSSKFICTCIGHSKHKSMHLVRHEYHMGSVIHKILSSSIGIFSSAIACYLITILILAFVSKSF